MRRSSPFRTRSVAAAAAIALVAVPLTTTAAGAAPADLPAPADALPPQNPATGANGASNMHGDSASSDTTPFAGPGTGPLSSEHIDLGAACPTVLEAADRFPIALCTTVLGRVPTVFLLSPDSGGKIAELPLTKGNLLGGVYAYLDEADRLVTIDGSNDLLRVGHRPDGNGGWELFIAERTPLDDVIDDGDGVVAASPDWRGRIWLATQRGKVVVADTRTGKKRTTALDTGETVANSISTAPEGTAITTDHATYLLNADEDNVPTITWRQGYDHGPARKPGQLSWGSGATPTFFGPRTGADYLAITDNAVPREHLLIYDARTGDQICSQPVLPQGASGTENSPVGFGNSVYVAGTYGYPYPATPDGAGPSEPASAPFEGGMTRIDIRTDGPGPDGSGCEVRWANETRSAAVPRLSTGDGLLYTVERKPGLLPNGPLATFDAVAIDPESGRTLSAHRLGASLLRDTLQMVGTITRDGVQYQGTVTGINRVRGN